MYKSAAKEIEILTPCKRWEGTPGRREPPIYAIQPPSLRYPVYHTKTSTVVYAERKTLHF